MNVNVVSTGWYMRRHNGGPSCTSGDLEFSLVRFFLKEPSNM